MSLKKDVNRYHLVGVGVGVRMGVGARVCRGGGILGEGDMCKGGGRVWLIVGDVTQRGE